MFKNLEMVMRDDLQEMEEAYADGHEITANDLAKADLIFHVLKSLATYRAMVEYDGEEARGYSRRGTAGRYASREMIEPYWDRR